MSGAVEVHGVGIGSVVVADRGKVYDGGEGDGNRAADGLGCCLL